MAKKNVERKCIKCQKSKPLNLENFYYFKSTGRYGDKCIECEKQIAREYYKEHKKEIDDRHKKWQDDNYEDHLIHVDTYRNKKAREGIREDFKNEV
jgi:hypothetical protein